MSDNKEITVSAPTSPEGKMAEGDGSKPSTDAPEPQTMAGIIDSYLHRVLDFQHCLITYMPMVIKYSKESYEKSKKALDEAIELTKADDKALQVQGIKKAAPALRRLRRSAMSRAPYVLESSLFLGLFSAFDAFTGDLLTCIYKKKPQLFKGINRQMPVAEILQHDSFDKLQNAILEQEIESFRRKSYVEQFEDLERTFGISLKKFKEWPSFVEHGQRRNLMTHCDGVVSEQYIKVCSENGYKFDEKVKVGDTIRLGPKYLIPCSEIMMEVGLMLGQTLWRKLFPEETTEAEGHLNLAIYESLAMEHWNRAIIFGEFAQSEMIQKTSSELARKISLVNCAIALKATGKKVEAETLMSKIDWSSSINEFKLAKEVIFEDYKEASEIMLKIGQKGELISESAYHTWPLFREFRSTDPFLETYEKVYGYPFAEQVQRTSGQEQQKVAEEIQKQDIKDVQRENLH